MEKYLEEILFKDRLPKYDFHDGLEIETLNQNFDCFLWQTCGRSLVASFRCIIGFHFVAFTLLPGLTEPNHPDYTEKTF